MSVSAKEQLLIDAGLLLVFVLNRPAVAASTTINFNSLPGSNNSLFAQFSESGFTVSAISGGWLIGQTYGDPPPYIYFNAAAGNTVAGSIAVTEGGATFNFSSINIYSSTTPIPYIFTGLLNNHTVFSNSGVVPNTFGNFALVTSPSSSIGIDTLDITLTNPAAPCCGNPVGLDDITVEETASTAPEPGTPSLVVAGFGGFWLLWQRLRRSRSPRLEAR